MAPTYDDLVKELQAALDIISYLEPEEYDDEEHRETYQREIARVQSVIDASKKWKGRDYV